MSFSCDNLNPSPLQSYNVHTIQTCNAHKLNVIRVKFNYGKSTVKYKGTKIYNEMPNDIIYCK